MSMYDVCVVGAGTIGSAAARHMAENNGSLKILLIGAFEKQNLGTGDMPGAYYDTGRITRMVDREPIWMMLGRRSMERYQDIEHRSGIPFYQEVGYLAIGGEDGELVPGLHAISLLTNTPFQTLDSSELKMKFPFYNFEDRHVGFHMEQNAGYINIRHMVRAQRLLAEKAGCDIVDDVVEHIIQPVEEDDPHTLITKDGRRLLARKVLLATGAFTHCKSLLPSHVLPDAQVQAEGVIKIEIPRYQLPDFKNMPTMVAAYEDGRTDSRGYILPPICYPDGRCYLKIGHGKVCPSPVDTAEQIHAWYTRTETDGTVEKHLRALTARFFPDLLKNDYIYDYCVTCHTPSGYPYIDMVTSTLGVAIVGNGRSAKCGDEIGRIAARMIVAGQWDSDLPKYHFRFIPKTTESKL